MAFMFADIRGYSSYTAAHGADAAATLAGRFLTVAGETVQAHRGSIRGTWGDEILAEFTSARDAVRAAVELQQRCVGEAVAEPEAPLTVGMGLDVGEISESEDAQSSGALNVAARLCSRAHSGEVLATRELVHLAGIVTGIVYEDAGSARLKGVTGRTAIVRLRSATASPQQESAFKRLLAGTPARRRVRRRRQLVAAAVGLALIAGTGTWWLARTRVDQPLTIPPDAIGVVNPESGALDDVVALPPGHRASAVVVGTEAAWLVDSAAGSVSRVDRDSHQVTQTIPVGTNPIAASELDGFLWVVNEGDGTVTRINERTNTTVDTQAVGKQPVAIAAGFGSLWIANRADNTVIRIDPAGRSASITIGVGDAPTGISAGTGAVWVTNEVDNTVSAIDPNHNTASPPTFVGAGPSAILALDSGVYVANHLEKTVSRIDPATRRETARIPVGDMPTSLSAVGGSVWVTNAADATLTRIDPDLSRGTATLATGGPPATGAADAEQLWVATGPSRSSTHRGGTLTVAAAEDWMDSLDPALSYQLWTWPALRMVYDGLVTYNISDGPAGQELVPDLAVSLPQPTDEGRTYSFTLRQGIRYSDGTLLRPGDVRRGLERLFIANEGNPLTGTPGGNRSYYLNIVGADACVAQPSTCSLADGITADDSSNTVRFHLLAPDPDFLHKLALPFATVVPAGAPMTDFGHSPYPGTGPYRIKAFSDPSGFGSADTANSKWTQQSLTLDRNPRFQIWSQAAQPDGYPDVIQYQPMSASDIYEALDTGRADLTQLNMLAPTSPNRIAQLKAEAPDRFHAGSVPYTAYVYMNSLRPPFDNLRARQALSYALDRKKLFGGDKVTCQLMPAGIPGYHPNCPYTIAPNPEEEWVGPDLDRARALAAASGTMAEPIRIAVWDIWADAGEHIANTLRSIGFTHVTVDALPNDALAAAETDPRSTVSVGMSGMAADFPTASSYYAWLFTCANPNPQAGRFCDHGIEALGKDASAMQLKDPARAEVLWQKVYDELAVQAPIIPFYEGAEEYLVSARANQNFVAGHMGPFLDQMWVK
jgi:YVTN family beta-propeller protein